MALLYNWRGSLNATGLPATLTGVYSVGLAADSARRLVRSIEALGGLLDAAETSYQSGATGARGRPSFAQIQASAAEAFDIWAASLASWAAALRGTHAVADRAARAAELREYLEQVGRVSDPTAATVGGRPYQLAFEDVCALSLTLEGESTGAITAPPREPAPTGARRTVLSSSTPALLVSAREQGAVGGQVRVAVSAGTRGLPARITGAVAGFATLSGDNALPLTINGSSRAAVFEGAHPEQLGTGPNAAARINAEVGDVARAYMNSEGRLVIETRAVGAPASIAVGSGGSSPLLAELGFTVGQAGAGSTTYTLTATRGDAYARTEVYPDVDWSAADYSTALARIAAASVLLGNVEALAPLRPDNDASPVALTGGAGGARANLVTRLSRASRLPSVAADPLYVAALQEFAAQYAAEWDGAPGFAWENPLANLNIGSVGSDYGLPRESYTFGTAVADLVTLVQRARLLGGLRGFTI